jgi:hypothetical protein
MGSGSSKPSVISGEFGRPTNGGSSSSFETTPYTPNNLSGSVKALLIGNNYTGTANELYGCIADVNRVRDMLTNWGITCTIMTDLESGNLKVTRDNILNNLTALLLSLTTDDTLIIYYSGHGALTNDTSGDEGAFGKDSVIVPIDYQSAGVIKDDTLRTELLKATQGKVFCFFDSCNSGSVCDLRYNIFSNTYRTVLTRSTVFNPKEWQKVFSFTENTTYTETNTDILSLSGSRDSQFSYEIQDSNGNYGGALTFAVVSVLRKETPDILISDFFTKVKAKLASWGITGQTPQLMSGKTFDDNLTFAQYMRI